MKSQHLIKAIIFFIVLFQVTDVTAQPDKLGTWNIANLTYHINSKFGLFTELQARSQQFIDDFYYYEIKGGFNYYLPQNNSLSFGIGNYGTYTYPGNFKEPVVSSEFRMWEQFVLNNKINRVKIEHRYRIEQRWINGDYFNRFRYRLNPIVPINHNSIIPRTIFFSTFDEVFFTNKAPYFLRNRFFVGAGYQFTKLFTLQMGFIRQFDYNTVNNGTGKNSIQTALLFNIDNTKKEIHPSSAD